MLLLFQIDLILVVRLFFFKLSSTESKKKTIEVSQLLVNLVHYGFEKFTKYLDKNNSSSSSSETRKDDQSDKETTEKIDTIEQYVLGMFPKISYQIKREKEATVLLFENQNEMFTIRVVLDEAKKSDQSEWCRIEWTRGSLDRLEVRSIENLDKFIQALNDLRRLLDDKSADNHNKKYNKDEDSLYL